MVLIDINDNAIEMLIAARNTKKRAFRSWSLSGLINEAIYEFHDKYAPGGTDNGKE